MTAAKIQKLSTANNTAFQATAIQGNSKPGKTSWINKHQE